MIKVGINGMGRIGRAIFRINLKHKQYKIVAINELDPDVNNIAYLLKYDSTYGKLNQNKISSSEDSIVVDGEKIPIYHEEKITDVPWSSHDVDIIVDSSGIYSNVLLAHAVIEQKLAKKIIVTHSPKDNIDLTLMIGVNEDKYDPEKHHVISSSICDANAATPFFNIINEAFKVEAGDITTLHPWLSYQNLLDGSLKSVSSPGHYWSDYALGRNCTYSLIPKSTTLIPAMSKVLPGVEDILDAMSFRIPTSIVSAADGTFILSQKVSLDDVQSVISEFVKKYPKVLKYDTRSLVSIDYLGNENAAIIDGRWLKVINNRIIKFVLWYDNEWGYAKRTYDIISFLLAN